MWLDSRYVFLKVPREVLGGTCRYVCFSKGLQRSSRGYAYHYRKSKGPKKKFGRVRVGMYVLLKVPREVLRGTRINIETLGGLKRSLEGYA